MPRPKLVEDGRFLVQPRGKPMPYDRSGSKNPRWNGGRRVRPDGYVECYAPGHPCAYRNRVLEHRLVMEACIGRYLLPTELVHHKNGNKGDNRLENLELTDRSRHAKHHNTGRQFPNRWEPKVEKSLVEVLYVRQRLTLREAAETLGMSYGSFRYHCRRYGIQIRRPDPWHNRRKAA